MSGLGDICKRCKKEPTTIISRKDTFCENCFIRFIRGKQRKQMQDDKFKVKFNDKVSRPRLLLDMKNNHESYVLLDILVSMFNEQLGQGPKAIRGFDLIVCIINDFKDKEYPIDLKAIYEYYTEDELNRLGVEFISIDVNSFVSDNEIENLKLDLQNFQTYMVKNSTNSNEIKTYEELLLQLTDKSTREDIKNIIHKDLIIKTAKDKSCSIVLEPNSMTKMAVDILSDTIRGRGAEIPIKSTDKYIGSLEILNPLRDVLNSEIKIYSDVRKLNELSPILKLNSTISDVSTKNKTVDEMVTEYFDTLEVEYPETVSTVVKIGAKLTNPINSDDDKNRENCCEICKVPIYHDPKKWLEQITVPGHVGPQNGEEKNNLRRYLDSIANDPRENELNELASAHVLLCYGCMVTLGVSEVKDFQWPKRPTREEILAEYILDND